MAALANCSTYFWRTEWLKMLHWGDVPPWEDPSGGSPYSWAFTSFQVSFQTADPGEGGTYLTSQCTYTGYANGAILRGSAYWTLTNPFAAAPKMTSAAPISGGLKTDVGTQDVNATSLVLVDGASLYSVARDVLGAPVTIAQNKFPSYSAGFYFVQYA